MPRIVLHIDRLVLHGVDRADAAAVVVDVLDDRELLLPPAEDD